MTTVFVSGCHGCVFRHAATTEATCSYSRRALPAVTDDGAPTWCPLREGSVTVHLTLEPTQARDSRASEVPKGFGRQLRKLRKADGQTMADLASLLGCSVSHISDIERGLALPPENGVLHVWLAAIGVDSQTMPTLLEWGRAVRQS